MNDRERIEHNAAKLEECYPPFGLLASKILAALEAQGLRPRIQEAWRSSEEQARAYASGRSQLRIGFHNTTGKEGVREALAVDVVDDDHPLAPPASFLLHLAAEARACGLETGILWGLPAPMKGGVDEAIRYKRWDAPVKVGWDPCHVQVLSITPEAAKEGARPTFG